MDDRAKCEIYTKLLNSLNKNWNLKEEINKDLYNNQIQLIKTDLLSKERSDQYKALQLLQILIENDVQDIRQDVITILRDNNLDPDLKASIFDSIGSYIEYLLRTNNVTSLASLYVYWKNYDLQKFYELLEFASLQDKQYQLEPTNYANLIVEYFLPMMLSPNQIHLKQPLIEVATKIAEMYPISNSSAEQYQEVLKKVPGLLSNIVNQQKSNGNVWREPLHFLTEYLDKKLSSPEVKEMFSNSSLNWDLVRIDLESNINIELIEYISENNLTLTAILFRGWKNLDPQKFTTALKEICQNNEYITNCKTFFYDKLIPVIMAPKNMSDPMKVYYIDIAMEFASSLPLSKLTSEEYNTFIESVNDYIKHISDLRDMRFEHWHKLWIFLVRLFGKKLHHSNTLINRLLRVVEHAFRNPSIEQRIRSYDCWKELIDNVSLDSHNISSEKQIRLLLTPLRAKFSKQEAVIVKRFEVFVYLIEKLQDKAILVLKEFLEFCFGNVGEDTDPNKSGQGKSLPELWPKSAKVLLAMLGHSHDITEHCLETNTEICLRSPVLNSNNISNHYCHTINSVSESCIRLKDVELSQEKNTILKCFWTSLLRIVLNDTVAKKDKCIEVLGKVLEKLLKDNDPYFNIIAAEILKSTINIDWPKVLPFVLDSLECFIKILFLVPLNEESYVDIEKFQILLCTANSPDVTSKVIQNLFHCFAEYETLESNVNVVAQLWIFLIGELEDYPKNKCLNFLVWPALYIHHITDSAKELLIYNHYKQIVTEFVEKSDDLQLGLLKSFEKILKNNPLLVKNVLTFVTMFTPKINNKEITNITLDILDLMMVVPSDGSSNHRQSLEMYLKKFFELNVTSIHDQDTIKKLCICFQHVLKFKHYDILPIAEASLKPLPEGIKWLYVKFLSMDFLMDLFDQETDVATAEKIHKLIDVFRNVKNPETKKVVTAFMPRGGRSAKIAKLVKEIPHSPKKPSGSPSTLRLFGKHIETHSPLSVKGSQLKELKDSPTSTKVMKGTPSKTRTSTPIRKPKVRIDDESNSKFVLIETKVKLDKSKLTEHQKEALIKRREDIPALYQDLSQSMTQSLDSSVSNKIGDIIDGFGKTDENCSKEIIKNIEQEEEKCTDNSTTKDTDDVGAESKKKLNKAGLKKAAVEAELKKLSMSIVGAEEFVATNSKRKRREKKLDLEENRETPNKEKKSKKLRDVAPMGDDSNLTTSTQEPEEKNDNLEAAELKQREGRLRGKGISAKRTDSPFERQVSTPTNEQRADDNTEESPSTSEDITKKKSTLGKIPLTCEKDGSASISNEEMYTESKLLEESYNELIKSTAGTKMNVKVDNVFKKIATKQEHPKTTEEKVVLLAESHSTEQAIDDTLKTYVPESMETKEVTVVKKDVTDVVNESTPTTPRKRGRPPGSVNKKRGSPPRYTKRGRPLGSKNSPPNMDSSASSTPKDENPNKNKLELFLQTSDENYPETVDILMTKLSDDKHTDNESDNKKPKKRGHSKSPRKDISKDDYKSCETIVLAEPIERDVYQFDTEQEMISESMIVPLRSPNKDSTLRLAVNTVSEPSVKKCLVISGTSKGTPAGRKSNRKIIPTKKLAQSQLFKSSESPKQYPAATKSKKLIFTAIPKDSEVPKKESLPDEKSTQSELFKHADEESEVSQPKSEKTESNIPLEETKSSTVADMDSAPLSQRIRQTYTSPLVTNLKRVSADKSIVQQFKPITKNDNDIIRKASKRKRPSSEDDDDDIIESSQDSTVSNVSAAKLKLSLTKRASFDKPIAAEIIENYEENKNNEEIIYNEFPNVNIDKGNVEVTPEETKKRRGRAAKHHVDNFELEVGTEVKKQRGRASKSPLKHDVSTLEENVSTVNLNIHNKSVDNDITRIEVTPEAKPQENLKNVGEYHGNNSTLGQKKSQTNSLKKYEDEARKHMVEAINRVATGMVDGRSKWKKRNSSLKFMKKSDNVIQDIIDDVRFSQECNQPINKDISSPDLMQGTQSQDTETQESGSLDINDEIHLQLNLPQKPILDETDKEIAGRDTASMSFGNSEEFKGFNVSSGDETGSTTNKTVTENRTLIADIAESENVIDSSEETKPDCKRTSLTRIPAVADKIIPVDKKDVSESEEIVASIEETIPASEIPVIAETECITTQDLVDSDVQQCVRLTNVSPVKKDIPVKDMGTPGTLESSLPTSPVTNDTPNRTSELLICTSDISPIGSKSSSDKSSSDDEFIEQRKLVPVALKFDEDAEVNDEKSPEKADDAPRKIGETSLEKAEKNEGEMTSSSPPKDGAKTDRDLKNIAERSSRFFDMIKTGSPTTLRLFNKRKSGQIMSPSASRIKKLMSNVKASSQSEISDNVSQEDILTFTREVPSPLAVPRSSILKRKHSDTIDEGLSPCPKRKRVNFSDPCTTSKKVFIREDNAAAQNIFAASSDDDIDKQFLEVLAANNIETPQSESDPIETEQSLQLKNPFLLRDDVPIYPDLVDCEESVSVISRKLTSPMFVNSLLSKLNGMNIKTLGDLAKQSEVRIARLPFKTPMVANVYKALDNYYHKNFKSKASKDKHESKCNGEPETGNGGRPLARLEVALVQMDIKDELLKIIERAIGQNVSTDTICSLLFSTVDHDEVFKYLKTHSSLETKDFIEEKDFPKIVKHIIETVGFPKTFEILTESSVVDFNCMMKRSIEKEPLGSLIEKRSLGELQAALWENVDNGTYTKKELFSSCFLPFVNSIDLTPVFNKMTVVQLEEIVVKRLKTEDYPMFIGKILKECSHSAEVKEEVLNHCSISEMTGNIIKKGSSQEVMSSFTYMFLAAEKGKVDLIQLFRLVSDSIINVLPPSKLMELSIEFQKKIPIKD